jgi:hypothetical protein
MIMGGRCLELMGSGGCILNARIAITKLLFKGLVFREIKGGYMDRSKVKDWAPIAAAVVNGKSLGFAFSLLRDMGFNESEAWEVFSAHNIGGDELFGSIEDIVNTMVSTIGLTLRVEDKPADKVFEAHCVCKRLDANGKCDAFCFHNRLKSRGVMVDCIGIESRPVISSGRIAGSTRL